MSNIDTANLCGVAYRAGRNPIINAIDDEAAILAAADTIDAQAARIAELEAVVEKLPKTADGVPITPGMTYWFEYEDEPGTFGEGMMGCIVNEELSENMSNCYSTRAAAEAAHRLANAPHDHDHIEGDKR